MNRTHRAQIDPEFITATLEDFKRHVLDKLRIKGYGTFASSHEILGVIVQETSEFEETVHQKTPSVSELLDIATACIFGAACLRSGNTDW